MTKKNANIIDAVGWRDVSAGDAADDTQTTFNYGGVSIQSRRVCERAVAKIDAHQRKTAAAIIGIGQELLAVKAALPHGEFGKWLQHYFGWSHRTASKYMQCAEIFGGKLESSSNLDPAAMHLLASSKCPDEICDSLIKRAEQGERITCKAVKNAIAAEQGDDEAATETDSSDQRTWNYSQCLEELRAVVDQWTPRCRDKAELIGMLQDLAEQLQNSMHVGQG